MPSVTVARMLPRSRPRFLALAIVLVAAGGVLPNALALATGWLVARIQTVATGGGGGALVWPLALVGTMFVLSNAHGPALEALGGVLAGRFDTALRARVMGMASAPAGIAHLEDPAVADRLAHAEELAKGWLVHAGAGGLPHVATARLRGLIAAGILGAFRWWVPIVVWASSRVVRALGIRSGLLFLRGIETHSHELRSARYIRDLLIAGTAGKETRIFGAARWFIDRSRRRWDEGMAEVWRERIRFEVLFIPAGILSAVATGLVAHRIGAVAAGGGITVASAVVLLQSIFTLHSGIAGAGDYDWWMQVGAKRARDGLALGDVAHRPDSDLRGSLPAPAVSGEIRFEGVRFSYPGQERTVLDGIDLDVEVGTSLAIVGENGAGKTTLIKLLCRLYDPTAGRITIDGSDLREVDPRAWRTRIGVIFQDFTRYELSARENIGFGAFHVMADDTAMTAAARLAGATGIIERAGWDVPLSRHYDNGVELSGGEWQRIALARALVAVEGGARILILDEPTANLDVRAEAELYEQFLEITKGVTTILISHRFSTVRMADRICVIEDGRVVERGSHDELLAHGERYATMFTAQASAYRDEEAAGHA